MGIKLLRACKGDNLPFWAVINEESSSHVQELKLKNKCVTTAEIITYLKQYNINEIAKDSIPLAQIKILSPITQNQRFLCVGANYKQHMIESGINPNKKNFNMLFRKDESSMCGANSDIIKPSLVKFLDYEIELGIVIGKNIDSTINITQENLHEYLAAITIVNDISARDIQIPQIQFYKGKSFRTFGPIGPYLYILDSSEFQYLNDLTLELTVNGNNRQKGNTKDLVFGIEKTITELSQIHNLDKGDLIATGTPCGCALRAPSGIKKFLGNLLPDEIKWKLFLKMQESQDNYLKVGDIIESKIYSTDGKINLGTQHNLVTQEI
ncbi:fumarylacetoacetate hydrolase family protein [Pseudofrancisella aestuarii]|uniref:Fumarylacetoacetate hydrolase family protein n=1 Tax=Pseudofrancisella aestuarii TaxID=2670347 RepID=A0ABV9T8W5_9GAMM|nr:fumarylacetoacetate hydrolase family protein [Pseudofrancisella aestuarii]